VLELAYDQVDYISAHAYYEPFGDDLDSFLASGVDLDHFIESVVATADAVRARLGRSKRINLSFDEWNVWRQSAYEEAGAPKGWSVAPRVIEDEYDVADAVVVGSLLVTLLRHCDRVTAACQAQLVNVIAPIRSEPGGPAWRQTIFHPFALTARHARGEVLRVRIDSPTMATQRHGEVPVVDAVATVQAQEISLFLVNRHRHEPVSVRVATGGFGEVELVEELTVSDADLGATNTAEHPDRVVPRNLGITTVDDHVLGAELPPASWTVITLRGRPPHPAGSVWNR
jgi:alpha-N-arabinofuranosidase